jgi:hypothetical protein
MEARSPEEDVLLRLVRDESVGPGLSRCDSSRLTRLASEQKVLLPLAVKILDEKAADPHWRAWASKTTLCAEGEERLCAAARDKTLKLLESRGISAILLKGASLSLGRFRDAGDIDLLIPEVSLPDAIRVLESARYRYRGFERNQYIRGREYRNWSSLLRWSCQFEFSEPNSGILFELHVAFFESSRVYDEDLSALRTSIGDFIASSVIDGETGLRLLRLEDRALLLALHAGVKRSPSRRDFILRHLIDLRALIGAGVDLRKVEDRAFRYGIAHHLLLLLIMDARISGSQRFEEAARRIEERLPELPAKIVHLHAACLSGVGVYSKTARFAYRLLSPFIIKSRPAARIKALLIVPLLLPPPYSLRELYGLPPRSLWVYPLYLLEPLRAVIRLLKKWGKLLDARSRRVSPAAGVGP